MKNFDSEITKIILRAAGEESSIFDVLCELRPNLIRGDSLENFKDSIEDGISIIAEFRKAGKIDVYKQDRGDKLSLTDDIYNTYLYIP